jgi:hypothetical protein
MSKLIQLPEFKPLPISTDAADVNENIDLWLKQPSIVNSRYIQELLRPDKNGYKGFRFITTADLTDTVRTEQFMKFVKPVSKAGIHMEFIFIRYYKRTDRFNPFWFGVERTDIICRVKYTGEVFMYNTDAELKRKIQSYNT